MVRHDIHRVYFIGPKPAEGSGLGAQRRLAGGHLGRKQQPHHLVAVAVRVSRHLVRAGIHPDQPGQPEAGGGRRRARSARKRGMVTASG